MFCNSRLSFLGLVRVILLRLLINVGRYVSDPLEISRNSVSLEDLTWVWQHFWRV